MNHVDTLKKAREKLVDMRRRVATGMSGTAGISAHDMANLKAFQDAVEAVDR